MTNVHYIHTEHVPPHEASSVMDESVEALAAEHNLGGVVIDLSEKLAAKRTNDARENARANSEAYQDELAARIEAARATLRLQVANFRRQCGADEHTPIIRSLNRGVLVVKLVSRNPSHLRVDTHEYAEGESITIRLGHSPRTSQTTRFADDVKFEVLTGYEEAIVLDDAIENLAYYFAHTVVGMDGSNAQA